MIINTKGDQLMKQRYLNPESTAILVVDIQNDYCHAEGALAKMGRDISKIQDIIPNIQTLIKTARNRKVPIIFVQTIQDKYLVSQVWKNRPSINKDVNPLSICEKGSWGAEFYKLAPMSEDIILQKYRYSAFIGTELDLMLSNMKRESLIFTGVATNVCVESTARDGFLRDYSVTLVKDCCAAYIPDLHEASIRNIEGYFGIALQRKEIEEYWKKTIRHISKLNTSKLIKNWGLCKKRQKNRNISLTNNGKWKYPCNQLKGR